MTKGTMGDAIKGMGDGLHLERRRRQQGVRRRVDGDPLGWPGPSLRSQRRGMGCRMSAQNAGRGKAAMPTRREQEQFGKHRG